MTYSRMVELIAKRTGMPEAVIRIVLGVQNDIMRACLIRQETVHFPRLLKIHSEPRTYKVPERKLNGPDTFVEVERVSLRIHPMKDLKQEMNRWTSTE